MFGIGGGELMVIALVALIAVGPEQLPSVMRKLGGYASQIRRMSEGVRSEFMSGMDELDPSNWTGDGSDEKPIVPRGYAESSRTAAGERVPKPDPTTDEEETARDPVVGANGAGEAQEPSGESKPINTIAAANASPTPTPTPTPTPASESVDADSDETQSIQPDPGQPDPGQPDPVEPDPVEPGSAGREGIDAGAQNRLESDVDEELPST